MRTACLMWLQDSPRRPRHAPDFARAARRVEPRGERGAGLDPVRRAVHTRAPTNRTLTPERPMSETDPATPPAAPAATKWKPLEPNARRVLGVLIEKAKTTPAGYPMSVNAIVTGCNQKNNREPLMTLDDIEVERALDGLRTLGAVSEIDWMGRVSKYKHHAYEWMGVSRAELAVMAELLLRGAQAMGELRGRAARMEPIEDLAA